MYLEIFLVIFMLYSLLLKIVIDFIGSKEYIPFLF